MSRLTRTIYFVLALSALAVAAAETASADGFGNGLYGYLIGDFTIIGP